MSVASLLTQIFFELNRNFKDIGCELEVDFDRVFKKFRS